MSSQTVCSSAVVPSGTTWLGSRISVGALVSEPTARRHLKSLVNTGFGATEQNGRTTLYNRDKDRILMTRIRELREQAGRTELIDGIKRMKSRIREYEDTYDAISPEEFARGLSSEDAEGWEDLTSWRTTRQNLAIAQAALAYSEASEQLAA
jgi:hypothetical protein